MTPRWLPALFRRKDAGEVMLLCGLGNPGAKYADTRHNAGFMALDELAKKNGVQFSKGKFESHEAVLRRGGRRIILLKPDTFMNLSGRALSAAMRYYRVPLSHILVVYDDIDLPLGKVRMRAQGGAGTHNGMRSILEYLKDERFARIRIGIGRPGGEMDLADYVLGRFSVKEREALAPVFERAVQGAQAFYEEGLDCAMRIVN